ncbi:MAG: GNAT family N-acetyltransferase [Saprospiraceae bacterium]|nr:GNAT family N-acetyltransferase [Saprospiraceae bacterium]MDW8484764.1 GNAT family N-acetyltransferase [Saprospiraceae bacterium]
MLPPLPPEPQPVLQSERLKLEPLDREHFEELVALGKDPRIWEHFPESRAEEVTHWRHLEEALALRLAKEHHPYVIRLTANGKIAGYTRLHNWNAAHRRVETGSWLHPDFWRTGVNVESKWLLLRYCFEELCLVRVQFRTSPENVRSRLALEKLGATFEGILRNDRILPDGRCRHTALYSIIAEEWPKVKERLLQRIQRHQGSSQNTAIVTLVNAGIF